IQCTRRTKADMMGGVRLRSVQTYLHVGGLVAAGFDRTGKYLLTISHAGRGVFSVETWKREARDSALAYPDHGVGLGIGPIDGEQVPVTELDDETEKLHLVSPDGRIHLDYE